MIAMWKLNILDKTVLHDKYVQVLCDKIAIELTKYRNHIPKDKYKNITFLADAKIPDWLNDASIIDNILSFKPKESLELYHNLMEGIFPNYVKNFKNRKYKDIEKNRGIPKAKKKKYKDLLALFSYVFDYDKFIAGQQDFSYAVAKMKGKNTCTYCNRSYTLTIDCDKTETITRPDFDHWFPKSEYPLLALSFYNLIPSCKICNSSVKGRTEFELGKHIHPYIQEKDSEFKFTRHLGKDMKWEIAIEYLDSSSQTKVINTLRDLKILEVYKYHSDLELKDVIDFRTSYNSTYLEELFNNTLKKFPSKSREEVYRMLFGAELEKENYLDRPFSKLKHDILEKEGLL